MYNRFMSQTIIVTLVLWNLICRAIHINTSWLMYVVVYMLQWQYCWIKNIFIFILYILCLYTWYDTTAKQSSPHLFIYNCIVLYCTDNDKLYIQSHEVNMMDLWNKTCMLCYITEVCYIFDRDVRCIIYLVKPLDIRLLGLLR